MNAFSNIELQNDLDPKQFDTLNDMFDAAFNKNANGVSSTNRSHCKCRGNTGECRGRASTDDYAKVSIDKGGS